ncbi:hypothetical protein KIN20_003103 [Parelaphostrongylus tenuis]|uniref:Uncharacterized protein n=1 Tax=Parelaphostrongylus tenuis TaxID=148309 RepID=A0AAD5QDE1_PARTN|nr:hypothetical protein KIN20_003103 [Parelaphostrongylus tenuis]
MGIILLANAMAEILFIERTTQYTPAPVRSRHRLIQSAGAQEPPRTTMAKVENGDVREEEVELLFEKKETTEQQKQHSTPGLRPNPEITASFLSRIFFMFITPLLYNGYWKTLEASDMYEPLPEHESEAATKRLSMLVED